MHCEEFRRRLATDPYDRDAHFEAHRRDCPACTRAAREALAFERCLHAALSAEIEAGKSPQTALRDRRRKADRRPSGPGGPPRGSAGQRARGPRPTLAYFLLGPPLLLAVGWIWVHLSTAPDSDGALADVVVAHVRAEEPYRLRSEGTPESGLRLLLGSPAIGLDPALVQPLVQAVGPVGLARRCRFGGVDGVHLVIAGRRGPVSVLVLPGKTLSARREVRGGGLVGAVLPAGRGCLAIIWAAGEPLEPIARRMLQAVQGEPGSRR